MKGCGSWNVSSSRLICPSCMAWRRPLWVRGGRTVDLVRKDEIGEDRPEPGLEVRGTGVEDRYTQHVGREEVARKLDAAEREAQSGPKGMSQRGFTYPRDVLEENMSAGEERRHRKTYNLFLAVENLLDLADQTLEQIEGPRCVRYGCDIGQSYYPSNVWEARRGREK